MEDKYLIFVRMFSLKVLCFEFTWRPFFFFPLRKGLSAIEALFPQFQDVINTTVKQICPFQAMLPCPSAPNNVFYILTSFLSVLGIS